MGSNLHFSQPKLPLKHSNRFAYRCTAPGYTIRSALDIACPSSHFTIYSHDLTFSLMSQLNALPRGCVGSSENLRSRSTKRAVSPLAIPVLRLLFLRVLRRQKTRLRVKNIGGTRLPDEPKNFAVFESFVYRITPNWTLLKLTRVTTSFLRFFTPFEIVISPCNLVTIPRRPDSSLKSIHSS